MFLVGDFMSRKEVRYYKSYDDDFVTSKNQEYRLKDDYKWVHKNIIYKVCSYIIYIPFFIFSIIYCKLFLRVSFKNKKALKGHKGFFLFANHTQAVGDAFIPYLAMFPKRPYIIVDASNLGIPIIGKIIPILGALPIPKGIHKLKDFVSSVNYYACNDKIIVVYPEAHVWPYNTFIREFPSTSFKFPVDSNKPSFTMTITYKKTKYFKRPKIIIYCDGPFYPKDSSSKKEQIKDLHDKVFHSLVKYSKYSDYNYIEYKKRD